jgi:hypothetical protein
MTTTTAPHTHRFNDEQVCERCGSTYAEVQAERAAANAQVPTTRTAKAKAELDAAAKVNEKRIQAGHRRARYERTGR